MNIKDLDDLLDKLALCVANPPEAKRLAVLQESILDNRLTDEEIRRGYIAVRDREKPFWPSPGEFLGLARPQIDSATVFRGDGEEIFSCLIDHPERYGPYSPQVGRIYQREIIERHHGPAAGVAFRAVASRFRYGGPDEESLPWVRKEFLEAFTDARAKHPAPLALPAAPEPLSLPGGRTEAERAIPEGSDPSEDEKRFRAMVSGGFRDTPKPDFDTRKAELEKQAKELQGGAS